MAVSRIPQVHWESRPQAKLLGSLKSGCPGPVAGKQEQDSTYSQRLSSAKGNFHLSRAATCRNPTFPSRLSFRRWIINNIVVDRYCFLDGWCRYPREQRGQYKAMQTIRAVKIKVPLPTHRLNRNLSANANHLKVFNIGWYIGLGKTSVVKFLWAFKFFCDILQTKYYSS